MSPTFPAGESSPSQQITVRDEPNEDVSNEFGRTDSDFIHSKFRLLTAENLVQVQHAGTLDPLFRQ
ncbi:hypothetical protein BS78_10G220100 [Paspalum vaginatum]|nr:hypothetical protein BS78_10G220100 [Paspalum vaginatum]